jgi:hypothetical protein
MPHAIGRCECHLPVSRGTDGIGEGGRRDKNCVLVQGMGHRLLRGFACCHLFLDGRDNLDTADGGAGLCGGGPFFAGFVAYFFKKASLGFFGNLCQR